MADFEDVALEKNSPANHDRNLAGFHPNKVSVVSFDDERLAKEIVVELYYCIV